MFVVDCCTDVTLEGWKEDQSPIVQYALLEVLCNVVDELKIGQNDIRVAAVTFCGSTSTTIRWDLNDKLSYTTNVAGMRDTTNGGDMNYCDSSDSKDVGCGLEVCEIRVTRLN